LFDLRDINPSITRQDDVRAGATDQINLQYMQDMCWPGDLVWNRGLGHSSTCSSSSLVLHTLAFQNSLAKSIRGAGDKIIVHHNVAVASFLNVFVVVLPAIVGVTDIYIEPHLGFYSFKVPVDWVNSGLYSTSCVYGLFVDLFHHLV
jgi:hypothetical protein